MWQAKTIAGGNCRRGWLRWKLPANYHSAAQPDLLCHNVWKWPFCVCQNCRRRRSMSELHLDQAQQAKSSSTAGSLSAAVQRSMTVNRGRGSSHSSDRCSHWRGGSRAIVQRHLLCSANENCLGRLNALVSPDGVALRQQERTSGQKWCQG